MGIYQTTMEQNKNKGSVALPITSLYLTMYRNVENVHFCMFFFSTTLSISHTQRSDSTDRLVLHRRPSRLGDCLHWDRCSLCEESPRSSPCNQPALTCVTQRTQHRHKKRFISHNHSTEQHIHTQTNSSHGLALAPFLALQLPIL